MGVAMGYVQVNNIFHVPPILRFICDPLAYYDKYVRQNLMVKSRIVVASQYRD
jgi:hypothetical protein